MPSVLIFGGSGNLAKFITTRLLAKDKDYTVISVIRRAEHIPALTALGATPILHSLETSSVSDLVTLLQTHSSDAVIFAAGGGLRSFADPAFSHVVDRDAAIRVFDAMALAGGTKRLLLISTIDARDREKAVPSWYGEEDVRTGEQLWGMLPLYMDAKFQADKNLVEENGRRGLEYTIVRPTWYNEGGSTGKVSAGKVGTSPKISREDVADVFVACLENPGTVGCVFEVVGGETLVEEAMKRVAEEKVDSFGEEYR
ncbi:UPF0659 protein [Lachnellula suecica]|uniref:UPF0659 protein n=1 Tax=Lachnellula suecica TaxID=602035 RepID=A0A8T9CCI8_9HELO|nr:UPF0659 protein [Lachnellula suecica]